MAKNLTVSVLGCMILSASLISGCATTQPIEISTRPVPKPELVLPTADPIKARPVEWIIITEDNYQEVFDRLKKEGKNVVLFGLTDAGYENLSLNLNDIRTHIQQKNVIIIAYQNYYIRSQAALDGAVTVQ